MKKYWVPMLFAFIGWAFCAAIMGIGPTITSMQNTLIVHAIAGPLGFGLLAFIYHKKFGHVAPLPLALLFVSFVILVDFFLVAMFILKNFAMFTSFLGTWLPFTLIFMVSYLVGKSIRTPKPAAT